MSVPAAGIARGAGRVVVTGANGVIGSHLIRRLVRDGRPALAIVRTADQCAGQPVPCAARDLATVQSIADLLEPGDVVVHLAARAHVMRDRASDRLAAYRAENVTPMRMLCESGRAAGVRRVVFLSTAKVYGEGGRVAYRVEDPLAPADPYACSKMEAEEMLRAGMGDGSEWTILRPPFVYAPTRKGNFPRLVQLARLSTVLPLPLASVRNERSVIFVGNLVDAILQCADHPGARNRIFLPADAKDVSTPELLRAIAAAGGGQARLFPMPPGLLRVVATLAGRRAEMQRLTESLRVDGTALRRDLGWHPPYSLEEGIRHSLAADGDAALAQRGPS